MTRAQRAKKYYLGCTKEIKKKAIMNEIILSKAIKGNHLPDKSTFDVEFKKGNRKHFIEVKTIVRGKNDKVTMHPESLREKINKAKRQKAKVHTFVFDDRTGKLFYKEGVGSFRLSTMTEVSTIKTIIKWLN